MRTNVKENQFAKITKMDYLLHKERHEIIWDDIVKKIASVVSAVEGKCLVAAYRPSTTTTTTAGSLHAWELLLYR